MFAFIGLGVQELILLGMLGFGALAVVVLVLVSRSGRSRSGREAALEEENRRLRDDLDRRDDRPA